MPIATGTRLGRYEIRSIIGAGGMGEVYLAHDTQLERTVAVKVLPIKLAENQEKTKRFIQEAKTASALNHPNIITIHDIGEENSLLYIATEFIDGATLRDLMQTRPLDLTEVLDIASQVASALVVAHGAGIIHRDIKPENIMVRRDGYAKVLDFGLCKLMEEPTEISPHSITLAETDPNVVMGTPSYMSPEQVRGLQLDGRTDIWSLGTVIYEMLTGHKAFTGPTTSDIIVSVLEREPAPVSYFTRNSSEALEWIVNKCLRKDSDERYQTIKELFADLRSLKNRLHSGSDLSGGEFVRSTSNSFSNEMPATAFTGVAGKAQKTLLSTRQIEIDTGKVAAANQTHSGVRRLFTGVKNSATNPLWLGIVMVLLLSGLALEVYRFGIPFGKNWRGGLFQQSIKTAKLTTTGTVTRVAISPDGKYLVQATNDGSRQSLWIKQVATTSNVQIIPADEVIYRGLTFSHDGNYIFYVVQEGNNPIQALYQIPVLGGAPRKILTKIDSPVTVSPDNSQLAFVRRDRTDGTDTLIVAAVDGSAEKSLTVRRGSEFFSINGPAWSPDGKVIVNGAGTRAGGRSMNLVEARVADGQEKIISSQKWFDINRVAWIQDERGLMISAVEQNSSQSQVWQISYPDGQARKLTNDFNDYRDMSLTADSNSLVAVQSEARVNVWTAPAGSWDRVKQVTTGIGEYDGVRGLCWMPDGRLVYVSRVSGSQDIWIMNGNGTEKKQLTTVATRADVDPSVPQDGRFIVFTSNRAGNSNVWRIDPDGGNPKQLTKGSGEEFPNVSPDGQTVVYTSTVSSKFTLWKVSSEGGGPVQLTDKLSQWPVVSPDGKTVACWYREEAKSPWQIAVLPIEGGAPLYVFEVTPTAGTSIPVRWSADGKSITYIDTREGVSNIWSQPLEGGAAPRKVTDFKSDQMFWFDWSRDGKNFTCARGSVTSDAILISGFRS